jgi:hypothetical protein
MIGKYLQPFSSISTCTFHHFQVWFLAQIGYIFVVFRMHNFSNCYFQDIVGQEEGVAISSNSAVHVFNSTSSSTNNDFLLNGSRMVPSVSNSANTSLPKWVFFLSEYYQSKHSTIYFSYSRSRFSISSRAGMRPLNGSFASETSGNVSL